MELKNAMHDGAAFFGLIGVMVRCIDGSRQVTVTKQMQRKRWCPRQCKRQRGEQCGGHRYSECTEETARNTGDRDKRKKDDDRRNRGEHQWSSNLVQCATNRIDAGLATVPMN